MHQVRKTRFRKLALIVMMGLVPSAAFSAEVDTSLEAFLEADFTGSENITNIWWTLPAGTNSLYFAEGEDGCEWNLVEVLESTTDGFFGSYAGTEARIILDRAWEDEECDYDDFEDVVDNVDLAETTYDWYSQDAGGNIWYMGEDTLDGEGSNEGSFAAGCDGAEPGIVVLGDPIKGQSYQQELYEDEAEDRGKVLNFVSMNGLTCLKTKEWTPLEPGHVEHKFYCSDGEIGMLALIEELKGKTKLVELIDVDIDAPDAPAGPPFAEPACAD